MSAGITPRSPANLLLVDDRPANLDLLEIVLAPLEQRLVRASSGEEALAAMLRDEFAVVFLDVDMPGLNGYETAELIKAREKTKHVPIIFLTAFQADEAEARRGYDLGAVDYLFKPIDPVVLRSKASVFVDLFHLKHEAQDLAFRALHDPLTGLPNRALLNDRLTSALQRSRRTEVPVAAFFVDLDGFKPINDLFGHSAGDMLLVEIGRRLRESLREADTIARLGGDEFAVLSEPVANEAAASDIARRIIAAISKPVVINQSAVEVKASVGAALSTPQSHPDELLQAADKAMYAAKAAGGGSYQLATTAAL